jgi:hypothetical protein
MLSQEHTLFRWNWSPTEGMFIFLGANPTEAAARSASYIYRKGTEGGYLQDKDFGDLEAGLLKAMCWTGYSGERRATVKGWSKVLSGMNLRPLNPVEAKFLEKARLQAKKATGR